MDTLTFTEHPNVILATNTFIGIPIILQYEDTPLIEVIQQQGVGFTTSVPIYHSDGTSWRRSSDRSSTTPKRAGRPGSDWSTRIG